VDRDAVCEDSVGSYSCHCSSDYVGPDCSSRKLASCVDNPCENQSQCKTTQPQQDGTNFTCACLRGESCFILNELILKIHLSPSLRLGYTGRTCGTQIDYCQDQDCSGHGTCVSKWPDGFQCHCHQGWTKLKSVLQHSMHCFNFLNKICCCVFLGASRVLTIAKVRCF